MFERWTDYYVMIGGSSTALIGLLFVVVTLSAASESQLDLLRGHSVYASPTVFHLGVVLVISATALAPDPPALFTGIVLIVCALAGLIYVGWVLRQFKSQLRPPGFQTADLWMYGVAPGVIYVGLLAVSAIVLLRSPLAPQLLGLDTMLLLMVAVNNAWDLAGWLAHPQRKQQRTQGRKPKSP